MAKKLIRGVVPAQARKHPQDLIQTGSTDWAGTANAASSVSADHGQTCGPGWTRTSALILKGKSPVYQWALPHESRAGPGHPILIPRGGPRPWGLTEINGRAPC